MAMTKRLFRGRGHLSVIETVRIMCSCSVGAVNVGFRTWCLSFVFRDMWIRQMMYSTAMMWSAVETKPAWGWCQYQSVASARNTVCSPLPHRP